MSITEKNIRFKNGFPFSGRETLYIVPDGFRDTTFGLESKYRGLTYLNAVCKNLAYAGVDYYVPDFSGALPTLEEVRQRLEEAIGCEINCPTVIKVSPYGGSATLYEFSDGRTEGPFAREYEYHRLSRERSNEKRTDHSGVCMSIPLPSHRVNNSPRAILRRQAYDVDMSYPSVEVEEERKDEEEILIETLLEKLRAVNEEKLRGLGLDEDILRFILGQKKVFSHLRIDKHAKILLEDYGNREIKMDDKTKALYFLYLRHPEGICKKDLPDHYEELMDLYQSISGRGELEAMKATIAKLVDPFGNDANVSFSRIKKAFVEAFDESLAKAYYVNGDRGEARKVALDRSLVVWETIR